MWWFGFFLHEVAFGLLSVFLPLYVIAIGGSLVEIGIMAAIASLAAIPFSYLWGYLSDRSRRYKFYVLLSFLGLTIFLYLFTLATSVLMLIILYALMAILHVAHEPTKNILIAEWVSRSQWQKTYALYEGLAVIGSIIGLILGFFASAFNFGAANTLLLCSGLNLAAFFSSLLLVKDPHMVFERGLVGIEKSVSFAYQGIALASKVWNGSPVVEALRRENLYAFCGGLTLFSLATSLLYTPLPVFFSKDLGMAQSVVFAVFLLNGFGEAIAFFLLRGKSSEGGEKASLGKTVLIRSILALVLTATVLIPVYTAVLSIAVLTLMGFTYALIFIFMLSLSMELIPAGKAGLFNVLGGIGGASGAFLGPFLAEQIGFVSVFLIAGIVFLLAYVAFRIT